jgi:hypothetical protein
MASAAQDLIIVLRIAFPFAYLPGAAWCRAPRRPPQMPDAVSALLSSLAGLIELPVTENYVWSWLKTSEQGIATRHDDEEKNQSLSDAQTP